MTLVWGECKRLFVESVNALPGIDCTMPFPALAVIFGKLLARISDVLCSERKGC